MEVDSKNTEVSASAVASPTTSESAENEQETDGTPAEQAEEDDRQSSNAREISTATTSQDKKEGSSVTGEDHLNPPHLAESSDEDEDHELSQYELLRLERIKRNREYLSQLGLDNPDMMKGRKIVKKRKRKKPPQDLSSKRSSGRVRKTINYTEPSNSVRKLLKDTQPKISNPPNRKKRSSISLPKNNQHRMERFIFREFQRLKSHKSQVLKDTRRVVGAAEKEVAYWKKQVDLWQKRQERKRLNEIRKKEMEEQRAGFGGGTLKELLQNIDRRMPELLSAIERYDEEYVVGLVNLLFCFLLLLCMCVCMCLCLWHRLTPTTFRLQVELKNKRQRDWRLNGGFNCSVPLICFRKP